MTQSNEIFKLIPKIMGECGSIGKDKKNKQQGYSFRGIDDVYQALQKLLAKYEVFCVPQVIDVIREQKESKSGNVLLYTVLKIKYIFYASDGSSFEAIVTGEGMDSGDKSANKALSVAQKYALLQVFCIPTEDAKDPEHDSPQIASKKPQDASQGTKTSSGDKFTTDMTEQYTRLGKDGFMAVMTVHGYSKISNITELDEQVKVLTAMKATTKESK